MRAVSASAARASTGSLLRRNITYTFGRQVVAGLAQLLVAVIVARSLGPSGNGEYAIAILIPTVLVNFLNFGIGPANVFYLGRGEVSPRRAAEESVKLALVIAFVGVVAAVVILKLLGGELFPGVPFRLLLVGLIAFPIALMAGYLSTILQGLEDFRGYNWSVLLPSVVTLAGVSIALLLLDLGITAALISYAAGGLVGLIAVILFLLPRLLEVAPLDTSREEGDYRRRIFAYGWKAHLANILAFLNYRADLFLVNLFLGPAATGLYWIAVQVAERLWIFSHAASTVLFPRLAAMHDDPVARLRVTQRSFAGVLILTSVGALAAVAALFWLLEPVFGPEFADSFAPFLWLIPGIVAGAGARIQANCIAAAGRPEWNMYVAVVVVTINVIGNVILIPQYGIEGAAIATSIAYVVNAVAKIVLVQKTAMTTETSARASERG